MSKIWYLSPSNQSANLGVNGYGNERDQMYRLSDAITPHLDRCGVSFHVADMDMLIAQRATEANEMDAAYYLAFHSNAGGNGSAYGPVAYYFSAGKQLAETLVEQLKVTGQPSNRSTSIVKNQGLYELRAPKAPAVLLEVDFHDSAIGVDFLTTRRQDAAEAIAKAIVAVDGKQWVDAKSEKDRAIELGLFDKDEQGSYRWNDPMTREEAAKAMIRLKNS